MNESQMTTTQYLFSGRVQGVGFRWTTQRIATRFPVTGFVRNLSDGRVELVVRGTTQDVSNFLAQIHQQLGSNIESMEECAYASDEPFAQFAIRQTL